MTPIMLIPLAVAEVLVPLQGHVCGDILGSLLET